MEVILSNVGLVDGVETRRSAGTSLWGVQPVPSEVLLLLSDQVEGKLVSVRERLFLRLKPEDILIISPVLCWSVEEQLPLLLFHRTTLILDSDLSLEPLIRVVEVQYAGFSTRGTDTSLRTSPLKSPI